MARRIPDGTIGRFRVDAMHAADTHPFVLAGSAFVLGLAMGLLLKGAAQQMYQRARGTLWHRGYNRTVTYDDNLPDSLARREPAPEEGQPRFGGTGALGASPAAVVSPQPEKSGNGAGDRT